MERWFDLNGSAVRVNAEGEDLVRPLLLYLEELSSSPAASPDFSFTLSRSEHLPDPPPGSETLSEGMLPEGRAGRLLAAGDTQWFLLPGELALAMDRIRGHALFVVRPGRESLIGGTAALQAISAALVQSGQHLIHGAALCLPRAERAMLLIAPSGVGKTTSSLALALAGFGLLTDDAAVLDTRQIAQSGKARVWGLPRPLKVHRHTAELLPAVKPLLRGAWDANGEQGLHRSRLPGVIALPPARAVELAAVVLLGQRVEGAHIVRRAQRSEILLKTATDNVFRGPRSVTDNDVNRFRAIASAIGAAAGYQLNVGSDLATLGEALISGLQ